MSFLKAQPADAPSMPVERHLSPSTLRFIKLAGRFWIIMNDDLKGPAMHALELIIRVVALGFDIRGHIPQSDGFESFRDESGPTGLLGNIAMFLTTVFCIAAAVAFVVLLAVRWLN